MTGHAQGSVEHSSRPFRYQVLDVWFAAYPAWCTLLVYLSWANEPMLTGQTTPPALIAVGLPGLLAAILTAFWCLWMLDKTHKGLQKAKWYLLVLCLFPFAPTLCFFTQLREHLQERNISSVSEDTL